MLLLPVKNCRMSGPHGPAVATGAYRGLEFEVRDASGCWWARLDRVTPEPFIGQEVSLATNDGTDEGIVVGVRDYAGLHLKLVQFAETGETRWIDWRLLAQANGISLRAKAGFVGGRLDHAERFRLRTLARALSIWDMNTGALGRLDIDPLPHQIDVARRVITSATRRWLLADDVGLGKTIEVGLILHALESRNQCRRVLVVAPAGLAPQWKDEMSQKFNRRFEIMGRDFNPDGPDALKLRENVIVSLDLAKQEKRAELLQRGGRWDVIIFDEAHRLGVTDRGETTQRYRLARSLRDRAATFLLLTATPHQGKERHFKELLELVRPDLKSDIARLGASPEVLGNIVIRNPKSQVTDAHGELIFKGHDTWMRQIDPSKAQADAGHHLTQYLHDGYRAGDSAGDRTVGRAIGFVMTTYRKLASSSPAAILSAMHRRLARIEGRIDESTPLDEDAIDEFTGQRSVFFDREAEQIRILIPKLEAAQANDTKFRDFRDNILRPVLSSGQSLLIFTEYRATQDWLAHTIYSDMPEAGPCGIINGSMPATRKTDAVKAFNEGTYRIMISTEAGGEGLNMQKNCHVMVNYDLPWNPSRLVQRIGRLYRYGQTKRVQVFNLLGRDTFDAEALSLLLQKVDVIAEQMATAAPEGSEALKAEILGGILDNLDMESILEHARTGQARQTEAEIETAIARAREARDIEADLFQYAARSHLDTTGVFRRDDLMVFVEGMAKLLDIPIRGKRHNGMTIDLTLTHHGQAEFGRRHNISLSLDAERVDAQAGIYPLDLNTGFVDWLFRQARHRQNFDGVYGHTADKPTGLTVVKTVRWQDPIGTPLEEEIFAVRYGNAADIVPHADLATLLRTPLASRSNPPRVDPAALRAIEERTEAWLASRSRPERLPSIVTDMSGLVS